MGIPENYQIPIKEKGEYELLPEDMYQAQITKLELRENQPVYQSTDVEDKFSFEFTIVEEGAHKGRKLWLDVRTAMSAGWSGGNASWLYKIFCAVNNVKLSEDDVKTVSARSINEMEGKQLRLVVKQKANQKGEMKNKIEDVLPIKGDALDYEPPTNTGDEINVEDIPF